MQRNDALCHKQPFYIFHRLIDVNAEQCSKNIVFQMKAHLLQKLLFVGLSTIALMLAMPDNAQSSEDRRSAKETVQLEPAVVTGLIAWIVGRTGWANQDPPSIRFVTPSQLLKIYHVGDEDVLNDVGLKALYLIGTHTVYLPENWNQNDLLDRSVLLHELVHHLQQLNNVKAACLAAREPQAYDLQIEWLREQGIQDPYKFLNIDEFTITFMSLCQD